MLYFPQLTSGAIVQYPIRKMREGRTVVSCSPAGRTWKSLDSAYETVEWDLTLKGLNASERSAIETLFEATEGRLGEFTFLDPTDNLLLWSEDLTDTAWIKGPMLTLTAGVTDPAGTLLATRIVNSGAAAQQMAQSVAGPGSFRYCFSVYARSEAAATMTLYSTDGTNSAKTVAPVGTSWQRLIHSAQLSGTADSITAGIELQAGVSVDVCGCQLDCQPGPSSYRKTTSRSGVYSNCRFSEDTLTVIAEGADNYSCSFGLVARMAEAS